MERYFAVVYHKADVILVNKTLHEVLLYSSKKELATQVAPLTISPGAIWFWVFSI